METVDELPAAVRAAGESGWSDVQDPETGWPLETRQTDGAALDKLRATLRLVEAR